MRGFLQYDSSVVSLVLSVLLFSLLFNFRLTRRIKSRTGEYTGCSTILIFLLSLLPMHSSAYTHTHTHKNLPQEVLMLQVIASRLFLCSKSWICVCISLHQLLTHRLKNIYEDFLKKKKHGKLPNIRCTLVTKRGNSELQIPVRNLNPASILVYIYIFQKVRT